MKKHVLVKIWKNKNLWRRPDKKEKMHKKRGLKKMKMKKSFEFKGKQIIF